MSKTWEEFRDEYEHSGRQIICDWGIVDFSENTLNDLNKKYNKRYSYKDYLGFLDNTYRSNLPVRQCFQSFYYEGCMCTFRGQVSKKSANRICFKYLEVDGFDWSDEYHYGKEEHVWIDNKYFSKVKKGDKLRFEGKIYPYLKGTDKEKSIDWAVGEISNVEKIASYRQPTDEELNVQFVSSLQCELCMFADHCNGVFCMLPVGERINNNFNAEEK